MNRRILARALSHTVDERDAAQLALVSERAAHRRTALLAGEAEQVAHQLAQQLEEVMRERDGYRELLDGLIAAANKRSKGAAPGQRQTLAKLEAQLAARGR
jgi:hypothetical protein